MKLVLTLCLITQDNKILLGLKKRGFGAGKWNGFGGKVEAGETIQASLLREVKEESGLEIIDLAKVGLLNFEYHNKAEIFEVHVFKATKFSGEIQESEEMKPAWFEINDIPYDKMWPDDAHWLPLLLEGKKFSGRFIFGAGDVIKTKELKEVADL